VKTFVNLDIMLVASSGFGARGARTEAPGLRRQGRRLGKELEGNTLPGRLGD